MLNVRQANFSRLEAKEPGPLLKEGQIDRFPLTEMDGCICFLRR